MALQSSRVRPLRADLGQGLLVPGEPANGTLHPIQFHFHYGDTGGGQPTGQHHAHGGLIGDLAARARGKPTSGSDAAFQARDLIYAGSAHSPRGLSNVRVAGGPD